MFTTQTNPQAEQWRLDFLAAITKPLGEGIDVGDHRRYETAWVSCKLFDYEAMVQVSAPPFGTGLSPTDLRTYPDVRNVTAREAVEEILRDIIPLLELRTGRRIAR